LARAHSGAEEKQAAADRGEVPVHGVKGVGEDAAENGEQQNDVGEHAEPLTGVWRAGAQPDEGAKACKLRFSVFAVARSR
jgi:hypothetical protein